MRRFDCCDIVYIFPGFLTSKHGDVFGADDSSKVSFLSSNGTSCQPTATRNWLVDLQKLHKYDDVVQFSRFLPYLAKSTKLKPTN